MLLFGFTSLAASTAMQPVLQFNTTLFPWWQGFGSRVASAGPRGTYLHYTNIHQQQVSPLGCWTVAMGMYRSTAGQTADIQEAGVTNETPGNQWQAWVVPSTGMERLRETVESSRARSLTHTLTHTLSLSLQCLSIIASVFLLCCRCGKSTYRIWIYL